MADTLYDTYLSRDDRMKVKNRVDLPVTKGSSDYTTQSIAANNESVSEIDFTFSPPSESVFISRKALIRYRLYFQTTIESAGVPVNTNVFSLGINTCLQSYPLHRLATHTQVVINNSQVDMNVPDVLTALLQMQNEEDMREYQTLCPIQSDRYAKYEDAIIDINNPFAGYNHAYDKKNIPRGAQRINVTAVARSVGGVVIDNSLLKVNGVNDSWVINWNVQCVEPCLVAPFTCGKFGETSDSFLGVNRLNIKYNLSSNARRILSSAIPGNGNYQTLLTNVTDSALLVQYMTADATLLLPERIIHRFYQSYNFSNSNYQALDAGATRNFTFSSLQWGEVPNLVAVFARKQLQTCTARDPDALCPLSNLSVSFNNRTSLLSGMSVDELYLMSKRNGLQNVDFYQFLGLASKPNDAFDAGANGVLNDLYLAGSIILLNPARDLSISNPFVSNSSTGQFNFSWSANVTNNTDNQINVELVCVPFYERLLETVSGYSRVIQPAYNQQLVAQTIEKRVEGPDLPNDMLLGGKMDKIVAKGISGGVSRSGGASRSGGKSKLDSLLM
jgi:hypothetical protein